MIEERYCSPEVSKLLKEKGFKEEVLTYYFFDSEANDYFLERDNRFDNQNSWYDNYFSAPTHQMAIDWIRENFGIHIQCFRWPAEIKANKNSQTTWKPWYFEYTLLKPIGEVDIDCKLVGPFEFKTYEETVEEALKFVLTNLDNIK